MVSPMVNLSVNGEPVPVDNFVQEFIGKVVTAMLVVLKGTEAMRNINLAIKEDAVAINVNNTPLPANPFVSSFIKNTVLGMVSSLKGVGEIKGLEISITD